MTDITQPSRRAIDFVRRLCGLADRLAAHGVVIRELHCHWATFGSWIIEASSDEQEAARQEAVQRKDFSGAGPEVVRLIWDGREYRVRIEAAPTGKLSGPVKYAEEGLESLPTLDRAIEFAEEYLVKRLRS